MSAKETVSAFLQQLADILRHRTQNGVAIDQGCITGSQSHQPVCILNAEDADGRDTSGHDPPTFVSSSVDAKRGCVDSLAHITEPPRQSRSSNSDRTSPCAAE
jgi:hypothetical protein